MREVVLTSLPPQARPCSIKILSEGSKINPCDFASVRTWLSCIQQLGSRAIRESDIEMWRDTESSNT